MNIRLLVIQGKPAGKSLLFGPGEYFLGRGQECHVRFNSDWVSRQHCLVRVTHEQASVRDLGSRNGTLVNGNLVGLELPLREGDHIQVGPVVFEVHLDPSRDPDSAPSSTPIISSNESDRNLGSRPLDSTILPPFLPRDDE